jgi:long-chain acyl-CoA synthetase
MIVSCPESLEYPDVPAGAILAGAARRWNGRTAFRAGDRELSFTQLYERACSFAHALDAEGIGKGHIVAVHLANCFEFAVAYHGILLAGATYTPANPLLPAADLAFQLADSGAELVVTSESSVTAVEAVRDRTSVRRVVTAGDDFERFLAGHPTSRPDIEIDIHHDVAHLAYTGGTTGRSKGVVVPHRNVVVNTLQSACWISGSEPRVDTDGGLWVEQTSDPEEYPNRQGTGVMIAQSPWFHVMGTVGSLDVQLMTGTTQIIHPRFDPKRFLEDVAHFGVTAISGAPPLYAALVARPEFADATFDSVKYLSSAAAPLPGQLLEAIRAGFGKDVVINEAYGLTEVTLVAASGPAGRSVTRKAGSVGCPMYDTQIKLAADDSDRSLSPGEPGEVCIKGPQVMVGYLNRPEETATTLVDGWLHTGDIGKVDEEGFFYLLDRKKDLIIRGGFNVYPAEIETVLHDHPAIREAAVVAVPHRVLGEEPCAVVAFRPGAEVEQAELEAFCAERLADFKRPRQWRFVDELPRNAMGKILKRDLRDQLAAEVAS